jgi:hypothetical protein
MEDAVLTHQAGDGEMIGRVGIEEGRDHQVEQPRHKKKDGCPGESVSDVFLFHSAFLRHPEEGRAPQKRPVPFHPAGSTIVVEESPRSKKRLIVDSSGSRQ